MVSKKEIVEDNGIDELVELVKHETQLENLKHKHKTDEINLEFEKKKEIELSKFDHEMQLQKIKSAEIRKAQERRATQQDFSRSYP